MTYGSSAASETGNSYATRNTGSLWQWTLTEDTTGDTITGSPIFATNAASTSNAGTYNSTGYTSGLTSNLGGTFALTAGTGTGAYIIDPATLTYTADTVSRYTGEANPTFTGTVTGFISGQNQSNASTGTLTFTTTATSSSPAGTYAINGSGLTANNGNYTFIQASGNANALTIKTASLPAPVERDVTYPIQSSVANAANNTGTNPQITGTGFIINPTGSNGPAGNFDNYGDALHMPESSGDSSDTD